MKPGVWINGKRRIEGKWDYYWPSDRFIIWLKNKDRITGRQRTFTVTGERPEWGNWKLVNKEPV